MTYSFDQRSAGLPDLCSAPVMLHVALQCLAQPDGDISGGFLRRAPGRGAEYRSTLLRNPAAARPTPFSIVTRLASHPARASDRVSRAGTNRPGYARPCSTFPLAGPSHAR